MGEHCGMIKMSRGLTMSVRNHICATRSLKTLSSLAHWDCSTHLSSSQIMPVTINCGILLQLEILAFATQ